MTANSYMTYLGLPEGTEMPKGTRMLWLDDKAPDGWFIVQALFENRCVIIEKA